MVAGFSSPLAAVPYRPGPRSRQDQIARELMKQGGSTAPANKWQALARVAQGLLGGYMSKLDQDDRSAADAALFKGYQGTPLQGELDAQMSPEEVRGYGGGTEGALFRLSELGSGNEYGTNLSRQLMGFKVAQDQMLAAEARKDVRARGLYKFQQKHKAFPPVKPVKDTSVQENYDRAVAQGFPGTLMDYQMSLAMASQGIIYNPGLPQQTPVNDFLALGDAGGVAPQQPQPAAAAQPSVTVLPGGRSAIQAAQLAAAAERNRLTEQRLDPEKTAERERAKRTAALDVKNKAMMPSRRAAIVTKIARLPVLKKIMGEIKELSKGMMTSGVTGQVMSNIANSDQYKLEAKLLTVKSAVGIDELIRAKAEGATFGALSDTEMALLISSMGALDGNLGPKELASTLDTILELQTKALGRYKADFTEMYPDIKRPWEIAAPVSGKTTGFTVTIE